MVPTGGTNGEPTYQKPSSGIQAPDLGLSNILIESFVGLEDRAASQVPIAPSHTDLGMAQMDAFDAQAQILAQSQQNTKAMGSTDQLPKNVTILTRRDL